MSSGPLPKQRFWFLVSDSDWLDGGLWLLSPTWASAANLPPSAAINGRGALLDSNWKLPLRKIWTWTSRKSVSAYGRTRNGYDEKHWRERCGFPVILGIFLPSCLTCAEHRLRGRNVTNNRMTHRHVNAEHLTVGRRLCFIRRQILCAHG